MGEGFSELEYEIINNVKKIFAIARLLSIILICYIWIFEAIKPGYLPIVPLTIIILLAFIISIPFFKNPYLIKKQFLIALLLYSFCITAAIFLQGGIFDPTTSLLYCFIILVSSFLLESYIAYIIAAASIIQYLILIWLQYYKVIPILMHRRVNIPLKVILDVSISIIIYSFFIAFVSHKLANYMNLQSKNLYLTIDKLQQLSKLDPLTETYNRRYFESIFKEKLNKCKEHFLPFSLILIDVDHLDKINFRFGYLNGDEALRQTASIIKSCIKDNNLLFRYGGDEFVIIMPEVASAEAEQLGLMIRDRLRNENIFCYNNYSFPITACFGIVSLSKPGNMTIRDIINQANAALIEAKAQGPNSLFKISY